MNSFLMMRKPMRHFPGYKHLTSKDGAATEECLEYIDEIHLLPRNIHMYRQYRFVLTVSKKKWLSHKLDEHKIPKYCTFSNTCVDGYYTIKQEEEDEGDNDGDSMLFDKLIRHVVEINGCHWHACEVCGEGRQHYGRHGGKFIVCETHQIVHYLPYEILRKKGYLIHNIRDSECNKHPTQNLTINEFCKTRSSRRVDLLIVDK